MSQRSTKRIDGVISVTVGNDWITLNFESHQITIDKLKIYNGPNENSMTELTKEREARKLIEDENEMLKKAAEGGFRSDDKILSFLHIADERSEIALSEEDEWGWKKALSEIRKRARYILSSLEGNEPNEG